jgi:arsenate reductase
MREVGDRASLAASITCLFQGKQMTEITIYHNSRCSKSRQTLQLLRDRGIEPTIVEYLKQPLSAAQIRRLLVMLQMNPRELMRDKEAEYTALNLADPKLSEGALTEAMAEHPQLMERPIVVVGERAALGRPPERVLEIL